MFANLTMFITLKNNPVLK